jgi:hypothetical protein
VLAGHEAAAELTEHGGIEPGVVQLQGVKSARSAVPASRPGRLSGPLPAPAVRLSTQRALHKPHEFHECCPHPTVDHGEGMTEPR